MEVTDIKKTVTFINRLGKECYITRTGLAEFVMKDVDTFFMRLSKLDDGTIIMFDPSGGPYVGIRYQDYKGTNMGIFDDEWDGLFVESISWESEEIFLTCLYESPNPIEWVDIKGKLSS